MATMGRQMQQAGSSEHMFMKVVQAGVGNAPHFPPAAAFPDNSSYASGRMFRPSRSVNSGVELFNEPANPTVYTRSTSTKNNEARLLPADLSPGIFDVHSIDTELLPETSMLGLQDGAPSFMDRVFENDADLFPANKQQPNRTKMPFDSSPLRASVNDKAASGAKIKVVVRKRPLNKKEIMKKEEDIVTIEPNHTALTVHETKLKVDLTAYVEKHEFVFDAVLDDHVSNEEVYRVTVEPIVPAIFQKTKATCFAYGQTGSGKTFTMQPLPLKATQDILRLMDQGYRNQGYQLCVSFFEIYGGKLYDLLSDRRKLCMREDGKQQVCIVGLQEFKVSDVETIRDFIERGNAARSTGTTGANEESSRSHAILQLVIKRTVDESKPPRMAGKLSFIDLAGSERGADTTDNDRQTRMEGAQINKSLLALKECIRALDNDQVHIPFRGSKLTEVLRDSFVGDSRTVMISCISPNSGSCEHTLNTLRYADRVKSLSKSSNAKKDTNSSSTALRESSAAPLAAAQTSLTSQYAVENNNVDDHGRFGWNKQSDGDSFQNYAVDHGPPSGRKDEFRVGSLYADTRDNNNIGALNGYEPYKIQNVKEDATRVDKKQSNLSASIHWNASSKDVVEADLDVYDPDDEFNAIYKEEEELVAAHRKHVEENIEIVKEEMQLLLDIDKPGHPIEAYITKLRDILAQKANGILTLQNRLARFQRILNDQNILACPSASKEI